MATRFLTRSLLTSTRTFHSTISRSYASISSSSVPSPLSNLSHRLRPLISVATTTFRHVSPISTTVRGFATRQTTSSLSDSNPNWSNRPPKETILLDGCDFEHWLVVMEKPQGDPTRDEIIASYIKTLAKVVGNDEEARMKLYSVSTRCYYAFGALISEEVSHKLKDIEGVRWVLPDSYLDVKNKDYGGEPVINGVPVPYDPKYHEEWIRNNARANDRNRRNDRPRNFDRSRNFERRRENIQISGNQSGPPPNMGGPGGPPPNMGGPGGPPPNMGGPGGPPPNNMGGPGGPPPNNMGGPRGPPPNNMGGPPPNNMGGPPPNMGGQGGPPPSNMGGPMAPPPGNMGGFGGPPPRNVGPPPSNNWGGQPQHSGGPSGYGGGQPQGPPSYGGGQPNNWGQPQSNYGGPPNMGGMPPNNIGNAPNYQQQQNGPNSGGMPYQAGPGPNRDYQNSYNNPTVGSGGGNPYQTQDMPGRDMPPNNYQQ